MNIQEIDKWLKDQYGISYTEMSNEFNGASELLSKKYKEIERLNNIIEAIEKALKDNIEELKDLTFSYDRINEDKQILRFIQELKGSDKE